jgi:hypothetical protein
MNATPLVDKMRHIRGMQAAMRGKAIYKNEGDKFVGGGEWEIVTTFKGKSHEKGGIDLEVNDGYVRRISGVDDADDIASWGRFWKNLGATAYGIGEGLLDTLTFGATDPLTDWGYKALQDVGGSTEDEKREQDSLRGYGTTAGAVTGGVLTGGATTGSAIQQGAKGVGAGVSKGSPDSKLAQQVGVWLPAAGAVAGMFFGNKGYGAKTPGMSKAGLSMTGKSGGAAKNYQALQTLAKVGAYAGRGYSILSPVLNQRAPQMPTYTPPSRGGMPSGMFNTKSTEAAVQGGGGGPIAFGGASGGSNEGPADTPQEDLFYAQVPMREETMARLARYNVNV